MNKVLQEIQEALYSRDTLVHYGMPRRSGRYPYGSGKNPYQHTGDFLSRVEELRKQGMSEADIAKELKITTTQLRMQVSLAKDQRRALQAETARSMREHGYTLQEIADKLGYPNESSVRNLLNYNKKSHTEEVENLAKLLKQQVDEKGMLDVGAGVEKELGVSRETLNEALYLLGEEGYPNYSGRFPQATNPGKDTTQKVLCPPGTEHKEIYNLEEVNSLYDYTSDDGGKTFRKLQYPASMDSSRLQIIYAEDGGEAKDGLIEIRRGVEDLNLGDSHYAQVRILVDDNKYLKGMALYSDDLPDGVDVRFNTNKSNKVDKMDVLKNITNDPDNPFGALIKAEGQSTYIDKDGNEKLSLINKRAEEGDWNDWSNALPSQFLSKQKQSLIDKQLYLATTDKQEEYEAINSLTNPTLKKRLLLSFAEDCDAAAVDLKAAALPRQRYQVILPLESISDNEVYAPNYINGEKVVLVRFPHGGTFEIPTLTVNNKQAEGKKVIGQANDAVGINKKVANILSGADFDGDTVLVIPVNDKVKITTQKPFEGLKNFDTKLYSPDSSTPSKVVKNGKNSDEYYIRDGVTYKRLSKAATQTEMGKISNLITDMTLKGAKPEELERAVKHSMVVIDANKHCLDYKQSERDNGIAQLKKDYQGYTDSTGKYREGASTLISRAKSQTSVTKKTGSPQIDKETGKVTYKEAAVQTYVDKNGKTKTRTQRSTQMADTPDARTLSSGTPQEEAYAKFANSMKSLANKARKAAVNTTKIAYSQSAAKVYKSEVDDLKKQADIADSNAPRERQAQRTANTRVAKKKADNPDMSKAEEKKLKQQELTKARNETGAKRTTISISDKQWEAIQSGAVTESLLNRILNHVDTDKLKERALPNNSNKLTEAKKNKITAMHNSGYTNSEIAEAIGVSPSTVAKELS